MAHRNRHGVRLMLVLFTAGVFLPAYESQSGLLELYLERSCTAVDGRLTLADIVRKTDGDDAWPSLRSMALPYAPGSLMILSPSAVKSALREKHADSFVLVGRNVLVFPKEKIPVEQLPFYEKFLEFIEEETAGAIRVEVEVMGAFPLSAGSVGGFKFLKGPAAVRNGMKCGLAEIACISEGDPSEKSQTMTVILHPYARAAVPSAALRAGERFGADEVRMRDVDLSRFKDDLLLFDQAVGDYTARAALRADKPIPMRKIMRTAFVRAGDRVSITFVRNNITVGLHGRALSSGGYEEAVTVKPDHSSKRFAARVTGEKEVLVELR